MNNSEHKKIALIVNGCEIYLRNGNVLNVDAYRSDRLGIYVLTEKYASVVSANLDNSNGRKKLVYIPYDMIEAVFYDVANSDTKGEESSMDDEPDQPLG